MQALVFLVLQSDACAGGCGIGVGGNCAIASSVLWFFAGVFSCGAGKDISDAEEAAQEEKAEDAQDAEAGDVENEEKA